MATYDEETLKLARRMVNARLRAAGRQVESFELDPLELEIYSSEADRSAQWFDSDGNVFDTKPVLVDRKLLEEALEQIEETFHEMRGDMQCTACGCPREHGPLPDLAIVRHHAPDCRYIRVRDALTKVLGT